MPAFAIAVDAPLVLARDELEVDLDVPREPGQYGYYYDYCCYYGYYGSQNDPPSALLLPPIGLAGSALFSAQGFEWTLGGGVRTRGNHYDVGEPFSLALVTPRVELGLRSLPFGPDGAIVHPAAFATAGAAAAVISATGWGTVVQPLAYLSAGGSVSFGAGPLRPRLDLVADATLADGRYSQSREVPDGDLTWEVNGGNLGAHALFGIEYRHLGDR